MTGPHDLGVWQCRYCGGCPDLGVRCRCGDRSNHAPAMPDPKAKPRAPAGPEGRRIHLSIAAGEDTCASEPGQFCRYLVTSHMGTRWHCHVFSEPDPRERSPMREQDGWILRHPECLKAERS